jgi:hypothetical protein
MELHLQDCPCELNASVPTSVGALSILLFVPPVKINPLNGHCPLALSPGFSLVPIGSLRIYFYLSLCRRSYWLWAGRPRSRISSPGRVKNFHFSISSRQALGTGGSFPGSKVAGA